MGAKLINCFEITKHFFFFFTYFAKETINNNYFEGLWVAPAPPSEAGKNNNYQQLPIIWSNNNY